MDPNGRRDKTRRIVIITLSVAIAGLTTALAASYERIGMGLAVATGYIILFMSAALLNVLMHASASYTKRILLLVFSICLLMLFLGGIAYILFNRTPGEESRADAEISISSAPQASRVTGETDNASSNLPDASSAEAAVNVPENETPKKDASEIMAAYVPEETSSGGAESIIQDNLHIDRAETPSIPVFIEPNVTEIMTIIGSADAATDIFITDDSVSVPDTPVFIEATVKDVDATVSIPSDPVFIEPRISDVNEDDAPVVPVIISGIDAETEIQIAEPVSETASSDNDFFSGLSPEEADFWADFYIAGEDELELADGTYYMSMTINGTEVGEVTVEMIGGQGNLVSDEFKNIVGGTVTDSMYDRIFSMGTSLIPLSYLEECGIRTLLNTADYLVALEFDPEDMPIRILSISGRSSIRRGSRPIAGGLELQPAAFTLSTDWSLTGRVGNFLTPQWYDTSAFTFSSSNSARLWDLYLDFSYSMDFSYDYFRFRFGSYRFYYDFPDAAIRLSFGNVSSQLFSPIGTSIGIAFEKSYSYARDGYVRPSQYEQMLVIEKPSEVIVLNEGREIYRNTLEIGTYRLRDFVLYTGANRITVRIEPLDGSEAEEIEFDIRYSSSLLAPGEILYGASLVTGRRIAAERTESLKGSFSIPLSGGDRLEYSALNLVASGYIRAGLTETLTLDTTIAVQNRPTTEKLFALNAKAAFEFTHANILGTTRYNLNVTESADENSRWGIPGIYASLGHQISTDLPALSSVSLGANWSTPEETGVDDRHRIALNAGVSGRVGIMSWSLTGSGTLLTDRLTRSSWNASLSTSFTLSSSIWLTASASLGGTFETAPSFSGRIGATLRFGSTGINASAGNSDAYVTARYSKGRHSASVTGRTYSYTDINSMSLEASYAYSGNYVDVDFGVNASQGFDRLGADFTLSTSSVFADGLLAFAAYAPSNYVLIKQDGALKGNVMSVGKPGSSSMEAIPSSFGIGFYNGLPSGETSDSFILYSQGDESSFSGFSSFPVNVSASRRKGYVLHVSAENRYTASGVVYLPDGIPYLNGSSPMYRVTIDDGIVSTENTESYIFTDSDGRFITEALEPGLYGFDVLYGVEWLLAILQIEDRTDDLGLMQCLVQTDDTGTYLLPDVYSGVLVYTLDSVMTSDGFFSMIYGGAAV